MSGDTEAIVAIVREVVEYLTRGDFAAVERMTEGRRLSREVLEEQVQALAGTLQMPPDAEFDRVREAIVLQGPNADFWPVDVDLWTEEEGRSDLTLEITLRPSSDGSIQPEIDNLHML